jgi:hypothetical protein
MFNVSRGTADKPAEGDMRVLDFQGEDRLTTTVDRKFFLEDSEAAYSAEKSSA